MKIIEFRLINTEDQYDETFNDGSAWSRVYEYPLVLKKLKELNANENSLIHNSSWGFDDVHIRFKNALSLLYTNTVHSDIKPSSLENTFIYNITTESPEELRDKFDFVINISTVEEVRFNHLKILQNLYNQVKEGGYLVITFDYPGLDLELIQRALNCKLETFENNLNGANSKLQNFTYRHLNCGLLIIKK